MMNRGVIAIAALIILSFSGGGTVNAAQELHELFQQVNDSVVVIHTLRVKERALSLEEEGFVEEQSIGSGVLISDTGQILTAAHVVHIEDKIVVEFLNGEEIPARVVVSTPWADISLLQLERLPASLSPAKLGDSDQVKVGERIFIIGAPYGLSHTFTSGYISARHRNERADDFMYEGEFFQTDAAVNQGNSGGPMFNLRGEVVGIASFILSKSGGFEGIGFAVTSNMARKLITENKFWSGMEGYMLRGRLAQVFNLPQEEGLLVQYIAENSLASRIGLKPSTLPVIMGEEEFLAGGDIIMEAQGLRVSSNPEVFDALKSALNTMRPGDTLTLKVLRGGKIVTLSTTVE